MDQDAFRNLLKRKRDEPAAPPPAAKAVEGEGEGEAETKKQAAFFSDLPEAKEALAENIPLDRSYVLAQKLMGTSKAALPPGWIVKTSRKQKKGAQYYVNKYTGEARREMPTLPAERRKPSDKDQKKKEAPKPKAPPKEATVTQALEKLQTSLKKEDKFKKAMKMVMHLMKGHMSESNAENFFTTVQVAFSMREWVHGPKTKKGYTMLMDIVSTKLELFPEELLPEIKIWHFQAATHNQLFTDDSYGFANAVTAVENIMRDKIGGYAAADKAAAAAGAGAGENGARAAAAEEGAEADSAPIRALWEAACVDCMRTMYETYKYAWAVMPVEKVFTTVYALRHGLADDHLRMQLEKMTASIRARKRRQ